MAVEKFLKNEDMKTKLLIAFLLTSNLLVFSQRRVSTYTYKGLLGKYAIVLNIYIPESWYNYDSGDYYYVKNKVVIEFEGSEQKTGKETKQRLYETVNGKRTGYFIFDSPDYFLSDIVNNQRITGKWYSMDGKRSYDVFLSRIK